MKIGLLGDTHDHLPNTLRAVEILNAEGVELALHTGDYIAPFVIPVLGRLNATMTGVFGNNDGDRDLLLKRCREEERIEIQGNFADIGVGGVRIALLHGHEGKLLADLIESGLFDLVVHGHTHRSTIGKKDKTLVVNPGEVCGYLTGKPSVAFYDTGSGQARTVFL